MSLLVIFVTSDEHLDSVHCSLSSSVANDCYVFASPLLSLAKQCIYTPEPFISEELVRIALALEDILLNKNVPQQVKTFYLFAPYDVTAC